MKIKSEIYTGQDSVFIGLNGEPQTRLRWKLTFGDPPSHVIDGFIPIGENVDLEEVQSCMDFLQKEWKGLVNSAR